ncbi:MAG TPA: hypothetical protein VLX92_03495 [Kofleriaceae bacterium]|nr:hypothetical protein [Kofleriaceae bacterium]
MALAASCVAGANEDESSTTQALSQGPWATSVTADTLIGGSDDDAEPLYICRAAYGTGEEVGKMRSYWAGCDFAINGVEKTIAPYQTLQPSWTYEYGGAVPSDLAEYAYSAVVRGFPNYIAVCRASYAGFTLIGWVGGAGCHVAWNGIDNVVSAYDVLVDAGTNNPGYLPLVLASPAYSGVPVWNSVRTASPYTGSVLPCFAHYGTGFYPGWMVDGDDTCAVALYGSELHLSSYDTLIPEWTTRSSGVSYLAGHDANGRAEGICSITDYAGVNNIQNGRWLSASDTCSIGYGGREGTAGPGSYQTVSTP